MEGITNPFGIDSGITVSAPASSNDQSSGENRARALRICFPSTAYPADFEFRLGRLSQAQFDTVLSAMSGDQALSLLEEVEGSTPQSRIAAIIDVNQGGPPAVLRELRDFHFLPRLICLGRVRKTDVIKDRPLNYWEVHQLMTSVAGHMDFDQAQVQFISNEEILAQVAAIEAMRLDDAVIDASLNKEQAIREFALPDLATWHILDGIVGFEWLPLQSAFKFNGQIFPVDNFARIKPECFDRFIDHMRVLPGRVHPVRFSDEDCLAVGYIASSFVYKIEPRGVAMTRNTLSVYVGPFSRGPLKTVAASIEAAVRESMRVIGQLQHALPKKNWYDYVCFAYAHAKYTGRITVNWEELRALGILSSVTDSAAATINGMRRLDGVMCSDPAAIRRALVGAEDYGDLWVSLGKATAALNLRRARVAKLAQTLSRMVDIGKNTFGQRFSDGLTEFVNAWRMLPDDLRAEATVDVHGVTNFFAIDELVHHMGAGGRVTLYHSMETRPSVWSTRSEVKYCDPKHGPVARGRIAIDLGLGRGAPVDISEAKTRWLSNYEAVVSRYSPDKSFKTYVSAVNAPVQLPFGLRTYFEKFDDVNFRATLRWHQADFLVIATRKLPRPKIFAGVNGDSDREFRVGPYVGWSTFIASRAALCQMGNMWVSWCDKMGVRMSCPYAPRCCERFQFSLDNYVSRRGAIELVARFGRKEIEADRQMSDVDDSLLEAALAGGRTEEADVSAMSLEGLVETVPEGPPSRRRKYGKDLEHGVGTSSPRLEQVPDEMGVPAGTLQVIPRGV
jgi:hypothetical protein